MKIDRYSRVEISEQEAFDAVYSGVIQQLDLVALSDGLAQFINAKRINADSIQTPRQLEDISDKSIAQFDRENQNQWFMPLNYCDDIIEYIYSLCETEEQVLRVEQELKLFIQYDLINLLKYLKYLVDTMRQNNIVWGVGRGSCVASYVLYLIGVHKINSLKYNLDINEFLKEK